MALAAALFASACGGEGLALPEPDAGTLAVSAAPDAGAAPDAAREPQCRALGDGEEFFPRAGDLVLNTKCDRVCHNTLGGFTCINHATLEVTDCDACQ